MDNQKDDLWQHFLDDAEAEQAKQRPATDGSQWVGKYDRRAKPRDEEPGDTQGD